RMIKWAVEISEYDISYLPRAAIKSQALAEFMTEATPAEEDVGKWFLYVDSSSILAGSGARIVLTILKGDKLKHSLRFDFNDSNNEAEYEVIIAGIKMGLDTGGRNLIVYSYFQRVTNQV
ncbi:UNVERIFIED_CONTAM: hypothetical protein Slati_4474400, partial [Sesamum latifolium]